jgi:hypothetical protein
LSEYETGGQGAVVVRVDLTPSPHSIATEKMTEHSIILKMLQASCHCIATISIVTRKIESFSALSLRLHYACHRGALQYTTGTREAVCARLSLLASLA